MGEGVSRTSRKLVGVQYLRALAAIMVVYFHATLRIPEYTSFLQVRSWALDVSRLGINGVHIFFVMSGFIMMATARRSTPSQFLSRRLARIIPLYWLLTTLWAALIFLPPHFAANNPLSVSYYLQSLLFIYYIAPNGALGPLLRPGWSLDVEMFFYAIFACALFAPHRWRLPIVCAVLTSAVVIGTYLTQDAPELWLITRPYVLEFCIGMAIVQFTSRLTLGRPICVALVVAGFATLIGGWADTDNPFLRYILPSSAVVLGVVVYEQRFGLPALRLPTLLGDASYSLYLSHTFALGAAGLFWKRVGLHSPGAFMLIAIAACILLALAVYQWLEQPLLSWLALRPVRDCRPGVSALPGSLPPVAE